MLQVSPFVPDRLGRPLPPPGVEDAVARADLVLLETSP